MARLPSSYHEIPPVVLLSSKLFAPPITVRILSPLASTYVSEKEQEWLQHMKGLYFRDKLVSWAAYCVSKTSLMYTPVPTLWLWYFTQMLSKILCTILIRCKLLLLHSNSQCLPWPRISNLHGEYHFVVMLRGLHAEMGPFKALRKWLNGTGWI